MANSMVEKEIRSLDQTSDKLWIESCNITLGIGGRSLPGSMLTNLRAVVTDCRVVDVKKGEKISFNTKESVDI